jgi:hypothetical protein
MVLRDNRLEAASSGRDRMPAAPPRESALAAPGHPNFLELMPKPTIRAVMVNNNRRIFGLLR